MQERSRKRRQRTLSFLDALGRAPVIDYDNVEPEDEEISPEEEAAVQEAREEIARGETVSFDDVKAKYGL